MRKVILFFLVIFISLLGFSQTGDDFYKTAKKTGNNKARISYFIKAGDAYQREKDLTKAVKVYQKAEKELDIINDYQLTCEVKTKLAEINKNLGRENHTINKLLEVEKIALKNKDDEILKVTYYKLYNLYLDSNEEDLANRYLKLIETFKDDEINEKLKVELEQKESKLEQLTEEKTQSSQELESAKKEVVKKQTELEEKVRLETKMRKLAVDQKSKIDVLNLENENKELKLGQQESELKTERLTKIIMYGGLVILTIIGSLVYYNFHMHKKDHAIISAQNKQIADSISYARKIQKSLIPTEQDLIELFDDAFIIYKPKDVVSGDFPWHFKKGNNIYLAAVDCTGHGVPGAMLAVVGTLLLNDITNDKDEYTTGEILDKLHATVKKTLKQGESQGSSNDGMDIALCKYNTETKQLTFSGAHRPLYLCANGEIKKIRGDAYPIGGLQYDRKRKPFKTIDILLNTGDSFFISSDGLPDQMEKTYQEKYGYKFYDEIINPMIIKNKPFIEIKNTIYQDIKQFQGSAYQLDDMLLIGVKV